MAEWQIDKRNDMKSNDLSMTNLATKIVFIIIIKNLNKNNF